MNCEESVPQIKIECSLCVQIAADWQNRDSSFSVHGLVKLGYKIRYKHSACVHNVIKPKFTSKGLQPEAKIKNRELIRSLRTAR